MRRAAEVPHRHAEAVVKGHGDAHAVGVGVAAELADEEPVVQDVVVAERGALREARRPRRVLDVDRVVGRQRGRHLGQARRIRFRPGQVVPVGRPDDRHLEQLGASGPYLGDHGLIVRRLERRRRHEVPDARLVQHELELVGPVGRVDRDEDGADGRGGELQQGPLGAVGGPDPDPVAGLDARAEQCSGEAVDVRCQLGVGPAAARGDVDQGLVAWHPGGRAPQVGTDGVAQKGSGRRARRVGGECAPGDRSARLSRPSHRRHLPSTKCCETCWPTSRPGACEGLTQLRPRLRVLPAEVGGRGGCTVDDLTRT